MAVRAAIARSIFGCAITIVWTGMPSAKRNRDGDHGLDLVTARMHYHCLIDGGTSYIRGGARAESPASALTLINDSGPTTATDVPPLRWATWHRYSAFGAPALKPPLPQHIGRKPSALRHFKEALAAGCIP
jgi:hypothetical protein